MNSEDTLVNPAPPISYFLSSSDLKDAVIYAEPAKPLYKIKGDARYVKIFDGTHPDRIIAVLHRRDILPDTISFQKQTTTTKKQVNLTRWFKRSKMPDGIATFAVETDHGKYFWRIVSKHRQKVYAEYDLDNPVASCYFHPSPGSDKPVFVLQSEGELLRDEIVVAYLIQRYRVEVETKALDLFTGPN